LLENAIGSVDLLLAAFDLDGIAAGDEAHAEGIPNQAQVLVASAEQKDGFIAIFKSQS